MVLAVVPVCRGELSSFLRLYVFVACQRVVSCVDSVWLQLARIIHALYDFTSYSINIMGTEEC
jgi:hypothetical protein